MPRKPKPTTESDPAATPKPRNKTARKKAAKASTALEPLTYRQRQFVAYYAGEAKGNGSEAARLAGFGSPRVTASRLLTKANIQAAISAKTTSVALSQDEVLARLSDIATVDIGPFLVISKDGTPSVDLRKLRRAGMTHLIRRIKPTAHGVVVEFHDTVRTLDLLGKYHGLFPDGGKKDDTPPDQRPRLTIPDVDDRSGKGDAS